MSASTTAASVLSGLPGAVPTPSGPDVGLPRHYGDPLGEQRALADGAALIDRGNRGVLLVPGADRLGWLHSICTQHLTDLSDGDTVEALVLSPHGHVEQQWQVTELDGQVWLDVEPGTHDAVLAYLQMMRFLKRVEPADVSAQWAALAVQGPSADTVLAAAGLPVPERPGRAVALPDGGLARRDATGITLIVPRDTAGAIADRLLEAGASAAGTWADDAVRAEARRARLNYETDHRTIPHEVGWIGTAVHLDKGCYRGQETVARVHNLGKPPRRLVLLHLAGESDELPEPGTPVEAAGRPVGFVGTAAHHWELGPIALAVVKRSLAADAALTVDGSPVAVDPSDR